MKRDVQPVSAAFVWAAVLLTAVYVVVHMGMLQRSLMQWAGLVNALLFGQ